MRRRFLAITFLAAAGIGLVSATAPALAAPAPAEAAKPRHCVTNLSAPATPTTCYDSFTTAIANATGGRITDAPADVQVAMKNRRLLARLDPVSAKDKAGATSRVKPAQTQSLAPVSIFYDEDSFRGESQVYTTDRDCTGPIDGQDFKLEYVGDYWNDRFESYKTYRNCFVRLWEHRGFQGAMIDFAGNRTDFGFLADEVSSIQWD